MPAVKEGMETVLFGIVKSNTLLQVRVGRRPLSKSKQGAPQHVVGLQYESRILYPLSQAEELLRQFTCRLVISPHVIKRLQSLYYQEELRSLPHSPAQLSCPGVNPFYFWSGKALGGHQ